MILGSLSKSLRRPLLCSLTLACLPRSCPFSLSPTTAKRLLRRLPREILSLSECPTPRQYQCGTLSGDLPYIRHMTFEVPLPFQVLLLLYKLVGNVCWYSSCMAATVWASTDLQLFIHAKHPPLSRAEYSHLLLVSFTCNFFSLSVSQMQYAFCWVLARVPSPSSVVTLE